MVLSTLERDVQEAFEHFIGSIGVYQSPHFVLARDNDEIALMFAYDPGNPYYFGCPDYHFSQQFSEYGERGSPGSFYLLRYAIDTTKSIGEIKILLARQRKESELAVAPLFEQQRGLEQQRTELKRRRAKRKQSRFWSIVLPDPETKLYALLEQTRELQSEIFNHPIQEQLRCYEKQDNFWKLLQQRYGQIVYRLLGVGIDVNDITARDKMNRSLFDHRPLTPTFFDLYGSKEMTQHLFEKAKEPSSFFPLVQELCRRTPFMAVFGIKKIVSEAEQQNHRQPNYLLFTKVSVAHLLDMETKERTDLRL